MSLFSFSSQVRCNKIIQITNPVATSGLIFSNLFTIVRVLIPFFEFYSLLSILRSDKLIVFNFDFRPSIHEKMFIKIETF